MEENLLGHHVEQEDAYIPWNIPAIHSKLFCDMRLIWKKIQTVYHEQLWTPRNIARTQLENHYLRRLYSKVDTKEMNEMKTSVDFL